MKKDIEMNRVFKSAGLSEPTELFSSKVMEQVYLERQLIMVKKTKPIISINILKSMALFYVLILVMIIAFQDSNNGAGRYYDIFSNISNLIVKNFKIWSIIPLIFSSSFILLLIDNYFNRKRQRKLL